MASIRQYKESDKELFKEGAWSLAKHSHQCSWIMDYPALWQEWHLAYACEMSPSSIYLYLSQDQLKGYALGWPNNRQYGLVFFFIILPKIIIKGIIKGVFLSGRFWQQLPLWILQLPILFQLRRYIFDAHQGYCHVVINDNGAHDRNGQQLLQDLILTLTAAGCREIYTMTSSGDSYKIDLLKQVGFKQAQHIKSVELIKRKYVSYEMVLWCYTSNHY